MRINILLLFLITRETQRTGGSAHGFGDQVVQIAVGRVGKLKGSQADIIQCLIIQHEALVGILHELMDRKSGVVRLDDGVRNLGVKKKTMQIFSYQLWLEEEMDCCYCESDLRLFKEK